MRHLPVVLAVLLLALMGLLAGSAVRRESIAIDEVAHVGAGVSYLQKFDLRMNQEHPALPKILAALPLVVRGVRADYSNASWTFSGSTFGNLLGEWVWGHYVALQWNDPYATIFWARMPMLLLTLLLGVFVYRYAGQLGGPWGGLLCLAAYVATPAFIVFGPLVLTDIPVALGVLLTLWRFAELWREPSRHNSMVMGLCLAAALLSKYSAGYLLVCFLVFRLSLRRRPVAGIPAGMASLRAWRELRGRAMWRGIFIAAAVSYVFNLIFSWNQPSDSLKILGSNAPSLILRRLLMPAWIYLRGLAIFVISSPRETYLLGHTYPHGVWFYFLVVFILKSTLAFLVMLFVAIPVAWFARRKQRPTPLVPPEYAFHWRAIWVSLLLFTGACLLSPMTISIRHFTIPILLLILLLAPIPRALEGLRNQGWKPARALMAAYTLLAAISLLSIYRQYPYFMPFLNELVSRQPAYKLVSDSNLDWNQTLPDVERFVRQSGIKHVLLDEFGFIDTSIYVPQAQFWDCQRPAAGDAGQWAVVSADMLDDSANCLWLMQYPHEIIAAGSMYAFHLPGAIPAVGEPGGPPLPENQRHFVGMPMDSRVIFLRCIKDPTLLESTMSGMMQRIREERAKQKALQEASREKR